MWEALLVVPLPNFGKWDAYINGSNGILFKGPSASYWEDPSTLWDEACHDIKDKHKHPFPANLATKAAHNAAELVIQESPNYQENSWLANMPKEHKDGLDMILDSTILSGATGSGKIHKEVHKVKSIQYKGLTTAVLTWKIAKAGGVQTEKQKEKFADIVSLMEV